MQNYLYITLSAVIFLTLCQIVLPVGSMKNISKMVIGVVFVVILGLPIIEFLSGNNNYNYQVSFDKNYYYYLGEIENSTIKLEVENILKKNNFTDYEIFIENVENEKIVKIFLKNVINENESHIDSIEEVKNQITKKCLSTIKGVEILIE